MFCKFACLHNVTLADSCVLIGGIHKHNLLDNRHDLYKRKFMILYNITSLEG